MEGEAEEQPLPSPDAPASEGGSSFWARVREHKVLQWGVAYVGAALALAQGVDVAGNDFECD